MAPHSSTLAWRIPWTEEPGGLPSMGSHRVGHDCSDWLSSSSSHLRDHSHQQWEHDFVNQKWLKTSHSNVLQLPFLCRSLLCHQCHSLDAGVTPVSLSYPKGNPFPSLIALYSVTFSFPWGSQIAKCLQWWFMTATWPSANPGYKAVKCVCQCVCLSLIATPYN